MTAAGEAVLGVAYSQVGVTEDPPYSNNVPYDDAWGFNSAWCATFVSWCGTTAGYPLPPINGPAGFSYCPDGQINAYSTGHAVGEGGVERGDVLIFSWEPFYYGSDGIAYCSYGVYAGSPAGDHTGFFVGWLGGGYMATVEGNTSVSDWDNGGTVMERGDRYTGQICCYWRYDSIWGGAGSLPPTPSSTLTGLGMFLLQNDQRGIWLMGPGYCYGLNGEEYSQVAGIPGIQTFNCGNNERAFDLIYQSCMNGAQASEIPGHAPPAH